jgi:anion-transporting  ArsA/GET3 family ATPase
VGEHAEMTNFDRKLLFVTGKGGVGKTTVSVALARAANQAGRRVLLTVTEPGGVAAMLGIKEVDEQIREVAPGLSCVLLRPEAALREYAEMTLHSKSLVRALLDNRYSKNFLAAIPGLHPWAVLGKAWFHAVETVGDRPRFDSVVFDAPATGHGLEMLRVPLVISEATAPGLLKRDAERAWRMISDPAQTGIVVVSLPEQLPLQESVELISELGQMALCPARVVLNARLPQIFAAGDAARLAQLSSDGGRTSAAVEVLDVAQERAQAELEQERVEERVLGMDLPVTVLPFVDSAGTPAGINILTAALGAS